MAVIDVQALLQPVAEDQPAGPDLEDDADFHALELAAAGSPERRMGDSIVPAEEPDWRAALKLASELLARSKNLRIAVTLTRSLLATRGLPGLAAGLEVLAGLIDDFWDDLYPALDPEDDNDPTERINVLLALTDRDGLLAQARACPLVRSRVFGVVAYRDIEIAESRASPAAGVAPMEAAAIGGAFQDGDLDELNATSTAATAALAALRALNDSLTNRVGTAQTPDFSPLTELLTHIGGLLQRHLGERQPGTAAPAAADVPALAAAQPTPSVGNQGPIASREEVVRTLDRLCDYYAVHEPSSPVPLLLQRARRLVTGNFVDIVRDLAPDALREVERVCGLESSS